MDRNFHVDKPDRVWVGDITAIWTIEGWLYLSTVIDLFSRKIVGWSVSKQMTKKLVISSMKTAIKSQKPGKKLMFHSDQGSQYANLDCQKLLKSIGAVQSMSRKANCWDNAVAESLFKTIKTELVYQEISRTRAEAELKIFDYIEVFYNRKRRHSTINYLAPDVFESQNLS